MSWLVTEDEALKRHLQGITVVDDNAARRPVQVKYSMPDAELSAQTYPMVVIDLIDIAEATERRMNGKVWELGYQPEGVPDTLPANTVLRPDLPEPYDLVYQVTSWSRHPRHDRQLLGIIGGELLPPRFGTLYVEKDGSARRLDRRGFAKRDTTDENGKRLFRNVWTVAVSSELWPYQLTPLLLAYNGVTLNGVPADLPDPPEESDPSLLTTPQDLVQYP